MTLESLGASLADRYRIERELGAGGMATELAADVAEATFDLRERRISFWILVAARLAIPPPADPHAPRSGH
jgi:hypothetical protein